MTQAAPPVPAFVPVPAFADVVAAAGRLAGIAVVTPLVESPFLNARTGARVFLKLETLQRTGSFKFRGAFNRLAQLSPKERETGVVAFSSGNHAQGVAAAAALLGMPASIVMPSDAPRIKIENTRALGASVILYDRKREKREEIAGRLAEEMRAMLVPAFDDFAVVAGQGTVGLEIAVQAKTAGVTPDVVIVPCSGGGLSAGVALALGGACPAARIVTAEPEGFDGARLSLASGERRSASADGATIADSLMAPAPGFIPFALLRAMDASGVAVGDAALKAAVKCAARDLKLIVEPGGAAALAALLSGAVPVRGRTVALVLSGGNIDPEMLQLCLNSAETF
jgi:threonine dehydratase